MPFDYRLVIELLRTRGDTIGHANLEPDWEPAVEWTRIVGLRMLGVWAPEASAEPAIEPLWLLQRCQPYMRGFRVHLTGRDNATWHEDFSIRYFAGLAQIAAARLVENSTLAAGEGFLYRVLAYELTTRTDDLRSAFTAVHQPPPLVLREVSRARLGASAPAGDTHADDFDVFIPAAVLEEASTLTRAAGDVETGGVLIGHLDREPDSPEIFVDITALIPARHTVGASTKLTFTSDTWTDVRRALELRRKHEMVLGWFHSHPQFAWCREKGCPPAEQRRCAAAAGFFSSDDLALHRTMFPRAFMVALVMTHSLKGITPRLFGWRAGSFAARGFRVLAGHAVAGETTHAAPIAV